MVSEKILLELQNDLSIEIEEKYIDFQTKQRTYVLEKPILQLNKLFYFSSGLAFPKDMYKEKLSSLSLFTELPYCMITKKIIDDCALLGKSFAQYSKNSFTIEIKNNQKVTIHTEKELIDAYPWQIITKEIYEKILQEKISDIRKEYKKNYTI